MTKLRECGGTLPLSDRSSPEAIAKMCGVSKGNFKNAIGGLYKQGRIVTHADRIELAAGKG
jgi:predicted RNA-binding protein (virulence factor B family)